MENDFLVFLNILGCQGSLNDEVAFAKALEDGPKSLEFTKLIHILAEELKNFCHLKKSVSVMNSPDESSSFLIELSSFLEEIGCPYKRLIKEDMSSYLQSKKDRLLLLDFLISELMAVRIVRVNCPQKKQCGVIRTVMQKSQLVKVLKDILILLKFKKPPPNITSENLFRKIAAKLEKEGDKLVGKPLYNKMLSEKNWRYLNKSCSELYVKYQKRRETLITRLENTMQTFECSDRLKDTVQSVYRQKREALKAKPNVKLSDVLAARTSLLRVKKTCAMENTKSKVCKGVIERGDHSSGNCGEEVRMQGSDGYSQADGLDQARPQTSLPVSNQNQHNHQTCEVPSGGYNQNGGYDNREGGFDNQGDNQNIGEPNQGLLLISGQATTEAGEGDNSASNGCGTSLGNISTQDESGGSLGIYSKEEPAEVTFLTLEDSTDNKPDAMDAKPLSSGTDASPLVAQDISALPSLKRKKMTGSAKRRRARLKREAAAANGSDKIATAEAGEGDNSASNGCGTSQGNTSTQDEIGVSLGDYSKEGLAEVISRQLE